MSDKIDKSLKDTSEKVGSNIIVFPQKLEEWIKNQGNSIDDIDQGQVAFIRFKFSRNIIRTIEVDDAKVAQIEKDIREGKIKESDYNGEKGDVIEVTEPPIQEIILPIRPVEDTLSGNWRGVEGLKLLQESFGKYLGWKIMKEMSGIASKTLPHEVMVAVKQGVLGGGLDNPHEALLYAGHERRSFSISYDFMKPESAEDEKRLVAILDTFRVCSIGNYDGYVITPPPLVTVSFVSLPNYNNFMRYTNCGIQSCKVSYGGTKGDAFNAMQSGLPFATLSLTFGEMDYVKTSNVTMSDTNISFKK